MATGAAGFPIGAPATAPPAPPAPTAYPAARQGPQGYGTLSTEKILSVLSSTWIPSHTAGGKDLAKSQRSLAWGFSLVLFTIYAAPTIIGLRLGADPDNAFWIGSEGMIFATIPVIFVLQHIAHVVSLKTNAPKAALLFWMAAIPSIMCACIGGFYMVEANYLYGQLNAPNCAAAGVLPGVQRLQAAYAAASQIYSECYTRHYELNGNTTNFHPPQLQDCEEWAEALDVNRIRNWKGYPTGSNHVRLEELWNREWTYLASMEINHDCGSFCTRGPQLWAGGSRVMCSCSGAVAVKMLVTAHQGLVLLWMGLIALIVLIPGYMAVKPMLEKLGYM